MNLNNLNKIYYVSMYGNDENDGLTPESAWKTIKNVDARSKILKEGDKVLFERGGVFRGSMKLTSGVTYSAYGKGDKPCMFGSLKNYAQRNLWEKDNVSNVWKMNVGNMSDVGNIVFDHGKHWALKRLEFNLTENFAFYHNMESGFLYLYLDEGNPGELYNDIEICSNDHILWGEDFVHDVIIDNLCVKYTGAHGICFWNGTNNITVRECEIGYIGGSMLDPTVRYGNGFEVVDNCDNILVEDNYVYQCYDAGITHQSSYPLGCKQRNIIFRRNRIEYCNYNIEYYVSTEYGMIEDTVYEDNILQYAGYGFGSVNRIGSNTSVLSHICCYTRKIPCKNFIIRNNVFDKSLRKLLAIGSPNDENGLGPVVTDNVYIHVKNKDKTEVAMILNKENDDETTLYGNTQEELEKAVALLDVNPKKVLLEP